ncbi:MAG: 7-cyano-7-deazaguanine synthase QueC [Calditrichales bacterium]|nr:MAG: 7-cyano-7-deazaguanine synthase QueC [Calditrichales bacterium]
MKRELAVVAVSGGMDSCVTSAIANDSFNLAFLHLNYGQKTEKREFRAFEEIAAFYNVTKRLVVDMHHFADIGGSSLTDPSIPVSPGDLKATQVPSSYVPFRNANILAIATSWAEVIGAQKIFIGAVQEDSSGYPDCRDSFFKAFNRVIAEGTHPDTHIVIETPLIHLSKKQIIEKGIALGAPLQLSWSCYRNEERACGTCDSCLLRLRGFKQAGIDDPIPYLTRQD